MKGRTLVRSASTILAGVFVSGCTVTGPNVLVLPGQGSTFEQFQADDTACRHIASGDGQTSQSRYDMTYIQCMYAKGHQVPALGGPPSGRSSTSRPATPRPADVPPPPQGPPPPAPPAPPR